MLKCDFCGTESDSVQRVALDSDYDRLTEKHVQKFACPKCSAKKEAERKAAKKEA
jgi:hypothetical protein